ncbi:alternate F1F0 ATPase, F1 subunit alpha [Methylocystis heyeri]|uniref:alternate F1F0 ATPase, F1 subunit alpha n=1 Tax=Methylocystis heyeri TaxID=391905 RepID=UPI0011357388|nr:alternate F1F0 ATPase, F1 subunit alpha [Methylocystis heyeri]
MSEKLRETVEGMFADLAEARREFEPGLRLRETGSVTSVATGIAKVSGLPNVAFEELIRFPGDILGIAFNVDPQEIGVVLLGDYEKLQAGDEALRTGRVMDVPVGESLLGRVIDPLGRPLDGGPPPATASRLPIERPAAAIMDRAPVTEPLQTGIKVIDALIPVGRGQRELILGDRQTGKTAIALDTILNQKDDGVVCIYCAIGQRASSVARAIAVLREKGAMDNTVVVVTRGNDAPGLAYIAPYAATSIAEHFMEAGRDVLIVYDDLTQHAQAYRELSLLLRRPPGREAFPGDIFYIHSRLLERATHLRAELGGGSLTALPIVETEAQNISAYIPTNLISITDGQIYLSPSLFELGVLPAVDVGKSVSRVGGKAQRAVYRAAAGDLKLAYAQFEELESFARFGARLDEASRKIIEHGQRIRATLRQSEFSPVSVPGQIAVLLALSEGLLDDVPLEKMAGAESALLDAEAAAPPELASRMQTASKLGDADRKAMLALARQALAPFRPTPEQPEPEAEPAAPPLTVAELKTDPQAAAAPAGGRTGKEPLGKSTLTLVAALAVAAGWFAFRPTEPGRAPQPTEPHAFSAAGRIAPPAWLAKIEPRASGKLESVNCAVDEPVEQGQLCARIDSTPYRAALQRREIENEAAHGQARQADAAFKKAQSAFQRLEQNAGRKAASRGRIEAAQKALELARSRAEEAQMALLESDAKLNEARDDLEKTELVAPISGIVIAKNAEDGRSVEPGQSPPPFVIANLDTVRIDAMTDDEAAGLVSPGLKVSFSVKNFPGQTFKGEVMRVIGGPGAKTTRIAVEATNPALVLRPGMETEVRFSPQEKGPAK